MTLESDAKSEQELTCQIKTDARNFPNFNLSTQKSQNFALEWAAFDQSTFELTK